MFLSEYNQRESFRTVTARRTPGRHAGGINEGKERVATDMLKDSEQLEKIARYSLLAEENILKLVKTRGVTVMCNS